MAGYNDERKLYEQLKKAYEDLGVDESADDKKLKKVYRFLAKKYHPDINPGDKEAEKKFKDISVGYALLSEEKNRRVYLKLKEKYGGEKTFTKRTERRTEKGKSKPKEEETNKYIFKRRDGSTIEILPVSKNNIEGQTVYSYRIIQYYKNKTISNILYGRINLNELFRTVDYCDFCINTFLSKENIEKSIVQYNGFLGYIEAASSKSGRKLYRMADRESMELFDISMEIGSQSFKENYIDIDEEDTNVFVEKAGTMIVNGKLVNQYVYYSEYRDLMDLIYSEDIDFNKAKRDGKYRNALKRLLIEERVEKKIKEGGYIGTLAYDPETNGYDIIVDNELVKALNVKQTEGR